MRYKFTYKIKLDEKNQVFDNSASSFFRQLDKADEILYRKFIILRNMMINIMYPENNITDYETFNFQNLSTQKSLSVNVDDIDISSSYSKTFYNYAFEQKMLNEPPIEGIESCMEVLTLKQDKISVDFYLYYFENKYSDLRVAFNSDDLTYSTHVYDTICRIIKTLNRTLKINALLKN